MLEEEISLHKEQWEKVTGALEYHKHCSEALQGREAGLQAELAQQEALVGELEGRLAQSMADQERLEGEAGVWRGREGEVRREAVSARQEALHEVCVHVCVTVCVCVCVCGFDTLCHYVCTHVHRLKS